MLRHLRAFIPAVVIFLAPGGGSFAQTPPKAAPPKPNPVKENYTKYEYRIPMRDGVKLFTTVYVPKDASRPYPFLMTRTPYSAGVQAQGELRYGVQWMPESIGPSREFEDAGYIFVEQDVRDVVVATIDQILADPMTAKRTGDVRW